MKKCDILGHNMGTISMRPLIRKTGEQHGIHMDEDIYCAGWCYELIYCKRKACDYWKYGYGDYKLKFENG